MTERARATAWALSLMLYAASAAAQSPPAADKVQAPAPPAKKVQAPAPPADKAEAPAAPADKTQAPAAAAPAEKVSDSQAPADKAQAPAAAVPADKAEAPAAPAAPAAAPADATATPASGAAPTEAAPAGSTPVAPGPAQAAPGAATPTEAAAAPATEAAPTAAPAAPASAEAPATTEAASEPAEAEASPKHAPGSASLIALGPAFGILNLPRFGVGLEALARIDLGWVVEIGATYWFENTHDLEATDLDLGLHPLAIIPFPAGGSGAAFSLTQVSGAVCPYEVPLRAGRLWACGGVHVGRMGVESHGFVGAEDPSRVLFGLDVYARWQYVIAGPLSLTYSAGLTVPLTRDRFVYRDRVGRTKELFQQTAVGGRVDLMLGVRF